MEIADPQCSGDIRIQFKVKIKKFIGKFIDFTCPDSGDPIVVFILFLGRGHIFTNMTGMKKMENTKQKLQ
jgi:hypothetical protein